MRAVVLGGSGFIGSSVAEALQDAGRDVVVADLAPSPWLREGIAFRQVDVTDAAAVAVAVEGAQIVYNFAGIADIDDARVRPVDTVGVNVLGNVNALEAARRAGVQRYVFASTVYVYSDSGSFYRASKQACELYVEEYQRQFGLDFTIVRYGTLYGPRADARNSVYRYLRAALVDRRIEVPSSGHELREYIHVEDAARLSVEILGEEYRNQHVILTGHHPTRFRDLLELIREMVGEDVEIVLHPEDKERTPAHYTLTPYVFRPRLGRKLVDRWYVDMGQGLLQCLQEIHDRELGGVPPA